jgi:uncharacterized protein YciI
MADKKHFLFMIRPTRAGFIDEPTADEERIMGDHFRYLKAALEAGTLLIAGPCLAGADTFGMGVLSMESEIEARVFMEADPSVRGGVQQMTLYPFKLSLWAGK